MKCDKLIRLKLNCIDDGDGDGDDDDDDEKRETLASPTTFM